MECINKKKISVCEGHVNMWNSFSTKEGGWVGIESHWDPNDNPKPPI